jgi:hypothetical protein
MGTVGSPTSRGKARQPSVTGILAKGCAVDTYCWFLKKIYQFDHLIPNENLESFHDENLGVTLKNVTPQRSRRKLETMVWSKKDRDFKSMNFIRREDVDKEPEITQHEILTDKRTNNKEMFTGMVIHQILGDTKDFLLVLKNAHVEDLSGPDCDPNSVLLLQVKNPLESIFSSGASEEFCRRAVESATLIPMAETFWGDNRPNEQSKRYEIQLSF